MSLARFRLTIAILSGLVGVLAGSSLAISVASAALPASARGASLDQLQAGDRVPGHYIVVFEDSVANPRGLARGQSEYHGGELGFLYRHALEGYSVSGLSKDDVEALRRNPQVKYVASDYVVEAESEEEEPGFETQAESNEGEEAEPQVIPTGIERIFAPASEALRIDGKDDFRVDADVAVIDTGIDPYHPDLNVAHRVSCVASENSEVKGCIENTGSDGSSHGTHVAGTIGALDNGFGVVGVAPGVRLWAVKVLNAQGSGFESQTVAGVDWVTAHAGQIEAANMSLGCKCSRPVLKEAIEASAEAGVVYAIAAGNDGKDVKTHDPAGNPDAITVSALADYDGKPGKKGSPTCNDRGPDDTLATFSNYGKEVNVAAPGVCIYSSEPGGAYGFKSGTSMATPHVAGAAALLASAKDPEDLEDVEGIRQTIEEEGSQAWEDTSKDGIQEPLLDVGDEAVFAPNDAVVSTGRAEILSPTEVTLKGAVNPGGQETEYRFEYGPTSEYGASAPAGGASAGSGSEYAAVEQTLEGLEAGTPYHYRLVATNSKGAFYGADRVFGVTAGPLAYTEGATEVEGTKATINGTVKPEGLETNYYFEYGKALFGSIILFPKTIPVPPASVGSGASSATVAQTVTELDPNQAYYYRLVAENEAGLAYGKIKAIPRPPVTTTDAATNVTTNTATLNARINPNALGATYHFEYDTAEYKEGEEKAHGTSVPVPDGKIDSLAINHDVAKAIEGLKGGTTYHFQVVAKNALGTAYGKDVSFTTSVKPPLVTTEAATAVKTSSATLNGTVNPEGSETSYWFEYGESEAYGSKTAEKSAGWGTANVAEAEPISGLTPGATYHFRIVAKNAAETVPGKDTTFTTPSYPLLNFAFGKEGTGNGEFKSPKGIAVDPSGNIWVTDTENNRIEEFSAKGEYLFSFGKEGSGYKAEFKAPKGIAIDSSGNLWIADTGNDRVLWYTAKGEYKGVIGKEGTEVTFSSPAGIAVTGSGPTIYVADTANNRVVKLNNSWKVVGIVNEGGKSGSGDGELKAPQGIALLGSRIWVADTGNNRIQSFNTSSFNFVSKFGKEGTGEGQLKAPTAIAPDFQERLWVVDSGNNRAQKFDKEGTWLDQIGEQGKGVGQFEAPTALALPAAQKVLVLDSGNNRVQSWSVKAELPTATTGTATNVGATSATLKGTVNPEGYATTYFFEWGESEAYGHKTEAKSAGSGTSGTVFEEPISGLKEGTTYHFRVVAENTAGIAQGKDKSFKTLKTPKATTEAASEVKATSAKLNGTVNPEGSETSYWFEYGESTSYGSKTAEKSAGSGSSNVAVSEAQGSLKANTTYHFRVVAKGAGVTVTGADKEFTTLKAPKATTEAATEVKATTAKLNGTVNPEGLATSYYFEYGKTTSYGTKVPASSKEVGSGSSNVAVSEALSGLTAGTTYHFRVVAEGTAAGVTVTGADKELTTLKAPKATTEAASEVKATAAKLNGTVNPEGSATGYWFEYGESTSYGSKTTEKSAGSGSSNVAVSEALGSLKANTTYHFRVVAEGAATVPGEDRTFVTAPTALCKSNPEGSCSEADRYPAKTAFTASAESSVTIANSVSDVVCTESTLAGETSSEAGTPLPLKISTWSLAGCSNKNGQSCTSTTTTALPESASLNWTEGADGSLAIGSGLQWKIVCSGISCTMTFQPTATLHGGSPGQIVIPETTLTKVSGTICPATKTFKATSYSVSTPKPVYVKQLY